MTWISLLPSEKGTDYRTKKLLENEQRYYNYQRERNGIHADRYCMDDHAGDCRHVQCVRLLCAQGCQGCIQGRHSERVGCTPSCQEERPHQL